MEYLYSSPKNKEKRCQEIRRVLPPVVTRVVDKLKEEDKTLFPIFLQNLEAYLVLDRITKKLARLHPKIPLYSIHDSIVTTPPYALLVKKVMQDDLESFFGIKPIVSVEHWSLNAREPP